MNNPTKDFLEQVLENTRKQIEKEIQEKLRLEYTKKIKLLVDGSIITQEDVDKYVDKTYYAPGLLQPKKPIPVRSGC